MMPGVSTTSPDPKHPRLHRLLRILRWGHFCVPTSRQRFRRFGCDGAVNREMETWQPRWVYFLCKNNSVNNTRRRQRPRPARLGTRALAHRARAAGSSASCAGQCRPFCSPPPCGGRRFLHGGRATTDRGQRGQHRRGCRGAREKRDRAERDIRRGTAGGRQQRGSRGSPPPRTSPWLGRFGEVVSERCVASLSTTSTHVWSAPGRPRPHPCPSWLRC